MAVSEYKIENKYRLGDLKPHIYLLDKTGATINTIVDSENIRVTGLTGRSMYEIEGLDVVLSSQQNYEGRFNFVNYVEIRIYENSLSAYTDILNMLRSETEFYVVVEDKMGEFYIMNIDFPAYFTYDYLFTDSPTTPNACTLRFETDSNFPVQHIERFTPSFLEKIVYKPCEYLHARIKKFQLTEVGRAFVTRSENGEFDNIQFTAGKNPFVEINFIKNSFQFRERYDGQKFVHTITFSIPLDEYKSYWEYTLTEFKSNRYSALLYTEAGNTIATGFETGYFPTYTIETSNENSVLNLITITMTDISSTPIAWNHIDPDDAVKDDGGKLVEPDLPTNPDGSAYDTSTCIGNNMKIYTIVQEQSKTGQLLNNYWVLEGWESYYASLNLNIVGTYTIDDEIGRKLQFYDYTCSLAEEPCNFLELPIKLIGFNYDHPIYDFYVKATSDWTFENIPDWINIGGFSNQYLTSNIEGGRGDVRYHFKMYCIGMDETEKRATITIRVCDKTYDFDVWFSPTYGDIETWVELSDEYICDEISDGYYRRYKKLQRYINNEPVSPPEYKRGESVSYFEGTLGECEDPLGKHEHEWWKNVGYMCEYLEWKEEGWWYARYEKLQKYFGTEPIIPEEFKKGEFLYIMEGSRQDCEDSDFIPQYYWKLRDVRICEVVNPKNEWIDVPGYICERAETEPYGVDVEGYICEEPLSTPQGVDVEGYICEETTDLQGVDVEGFICSELEDDEEQIVFYTKKDYNTSTYTISYLGKSSGTLQSNKLNETKFDRQDATTSGLSHTSSNMPNFIATAYAFPTLTTGSSMFESTNTTAKNFDIILPNFKGDKLTSGYRMFAMDNTYSNSNNYTNIYLPEFTGESITDASYMFQNCAVDFSQAFPKLNMRNITNASYMFTNWRKYNETDKLFNLENVLGNRITFENCTNFSRFIYNSTNLTGHIDLSSFNPTDTSTTYMFTDAFRGSGITSVDLSGISCDDELQFYAYEMFDSCSNLERVNLGGMRNITSSSWMFYRCPNLKEITCTREVYELYVNGANSIRSGSPAPEDITWNIVKCPEKTWEEVPGYICEETTEPFILNVFSNTSSKYTMLINGVTYECSPGVENTITIMDVTTPITNLSNWMSASSGTTADLPNRIKCDYSFPELVNTSGMFSSSRTINNIPYEIVFNKMKGDKITNASSMFKRGNLTCEYGDISRGTIVDTNAAITDVRFPLFTGENITNASLMFAGGAFDVQTAMPNLSLKKVTDVEFMFYENKNITNLENVLPNCDFSNVDRCARMFQGCENLTGHIDLSTLHEIIPYWGTKLMFYNCKNIESVDLSNWTFNNGGRVQCYFNQMFSGCTNLKYLDVSNFKFTGYSIYCYEMFYNCKNLQEIKCSQEFADYFGSKDVGLGRTLNELGILNIVK